MQKQFTYEVRVKLTMTFDSEKEGSRIDEAHLVLIPGGPETRIWKDREGMPNLMGIKAQTQALIQGLIASIGAGHKIGFPAKEHLDYIMKHLRKAYETPKSIDKGEYDLNS